MEKYNQSFDTLHKFYVEVRMRRHDGIYRWVSNSGAPRYLYSNKFEGYVGTCVDIHEQKMSNEQLEEIVRQRTTSLLIANNQLEASNHNLAEFAYVASHDLQEPLRKIKTFSQLLREESKEIPWEDLNTYLHKIDDSATRMSHLIEDLLDYSRLQNTQEAFVETDLNKIVDDVIKEFDLEISQKKAAIHFTELPALKAVPLRIHQLFHNLFSNSLKFIKPGTQPVITIKSKLLSSAELEQFTSLDRGIEYWKISFADNGIGFKQEFAEKAFTIFQRLNGRSEYEGTGIGLAICRKIVMNHGGLMIAHSKENEGTEFIIILPSS
jgi:two-component system CheB/CheR fusion protein